MHSVQSSVLTSVMEKVEALWGEELAFLQQLGRYPSTLGNEAPIQRYIEQYLKDMGLEVDSFVPDIKTISRLPGYSPVEWSYEGRPVVAGTLKTHGEKIGKSLILQGHIDVVSPEPVVYWNYDPWGSTIVGDKMYGRGIQDMKSGVAAMIFALKAIQQSGIELGADVQVQTVIEEECTGNGALALLDAGYHADGALIPEPFGPNGVVAQVGVIWLRIKVRGLGAHTERADKAVNAIEKAYVMVQALLDYQRVINSRQKHPEFANHNHPLNVNIGKIHAGDWPSSVPSECIIEARVGLYPGQDPEDIKQEVKEYLLRASEQDEWLRQTKPEISFYGFHAEGAEVDRQEEIFHFLKDAHLLTTGKELEYISVTATTDIRFFNLYYGIPATCYGPVGGNMHGADEWVDLESVKQVTKAYAAFILQWCKIR
ncbi:ArgE/DapE family deacylase [Bacillus sp. JJ1532]|uniref:ArgE/DapE family deacylase n=1 Tax=Bacillus sp. JJ1532 TaxID=3122958 RepID=UPI002FFDAA07